MPIGLSIIANRFLKASIAIRVQTGYTISYQLHFCLQSKFYYMGIHAHSPAHICVSQVACPLFFYTPLVCVYAGSDVVPLSKILSFFTGAESVPPWGSTCRLYSHSAQKECSPHHQPVHSTLHYQHSTTTSQLFSKKKCCMASSTMGSFGKRYKCCS